MKRVTYDGNFCDISMCTGFNCSRPCDQRKLWERLKAIEDILGDDYDLDRLRELVESDRDGRIFITLPYEEEEGPSVNDPVGPEGEPGVLDSKWYKRAGELMEADRDGRCMVMPSGGYADKDGENALKSAMNTRFYHNNPVTRYIADAVAEKLTREAAEAALKGDQHGQNL